MKLLLLLAFVASAYSAYFEPGDMQICDVSGSGNVDTFDGYRLTLGESQAQKTVFSSWEEGRNDPCKFSVVAYTDTTREHGQVVKWLSLSIGLHPANDCKFLANVRIEANRIVWRQHGKQSKEIEPPFNFMSEDGCNHLSLNGERGLLFVHSKTCQYGLNIYRYNDYISGFTIFIGDKYTGGMDGMCRDGDGSPSNDPSTCFSGYEPAENPDDIALTCKAPRPKPNDCSRSNPPKCEAPCDPFNCSGVCPLGWRNVFVDGCAVGCVCDGCPSDYDICPPNRYDRCFGTFMIDIRYGPYIDCKCRCQPCSEDRCASGIMIPPLEEGCKYVNVKDMPSTPSINQCSCPCDAATK